MNSLQKLAQRKGTRQFIKFCMVGAINTVVDWIFFSLFKIPLRGSGQTGKQLAKACSFVISGTSSYIINRRWTFRSTEARIGHQAVKFFIIAGIGMIINNIIFYFVTSPNVLDKSDLWGLVISTALTTFWNFFGNKYWTFVEHELS